MVAGQSPLPTGELIKEGVGHAHEILHSEVALARAEIHDEARVAAQGAALAGIALAFATLGVNFLLWTAFWALSAVFTQRASAAIVGAGALLVAGVVGLAARQRFKNIPSPEVTKRTLKENIEWVKKRTQ